MPRTSKQSRLSASNNTRLLARLTERERAVAALIADGRTNKEIAHKLFISIHTVKAHVGRVLYKLDKESRTEVAVLWVTSGWTIDDRR